MVHHNHLPFLLVHLVLDLVSRGDCEASRAGDHVPLLQEPKGVVETLTMTIVMIIIIIARAVIIKHHDHIIDLFTICGENFSIRGQKNSSEPHQVLFWKLDGTVGNAHLDKIRYNDDQQRLDRGELWEIDVTNKITKMWIFCKSAFVMAVTRECTIARVGQGLTGFFSPWHWGASKILYRALFSWPITERFLTLLRLHNNAKFLGHWSPGGNFALISRTVFVTNHWDPISHFSLTSISCW